MSGLPWWAWHGHGFYVWSAYGTAALAIALELWHLRAPRGEGADEPGPR